MATSIMRISCEWCGIETDELVVAHANHDRTDAREENLVALCGRCYLKHDLQNHVFNRAAIGIAFYE